MGPLAGIRVIELGQFVGAAYAARLLGDFGAEVIKIEARSGGALRAHGPFRGDRPALDEGGLHLALDGGKRSIILDLESQEDRSVAERLIGAADVFVSDWPLAVRQRLEIDTAALASRHPRLIAVGLGIFGEDGPQATAPAYDLDAMAMSGIAHCIGLPGREPLAMPFSQSAYQLGVNGAAAATLALLARDAGGQGQAIDIAAADVLASYLGTMALILICHNTGRMDRSGPRACGDAGTYPYVMLPCRDGLVQLIGRSRAEWDGLIAAMGNPPWADNPRYRDLRAMAAGYAAEVDALIKPWLARHSRAELLELAGRHGFTLAPVRTMDDVLATDQFRVRGYFGEVAHPRLGPITVPGVPYRLSATPAKPPRPAPALGADGDDIRAGGFMSQPQAAPRQSLGTPLAPLAGIRVLDFGWVWSGPMVTAILSEFGADVIRVEHRGRLDLNRMLGRPIGMTKEARPGPSIEFTPLFHQTNHNKRGITLNTKDPRGVALVKRLVERCDVVLENMNPGAMERAGLGYDALKAVNPGLVMVAMSAVGQTGPLRTMRAYAPIMASIVGLESQIGYPGEAPIGGLNFGLGDPNAAMHTLFPLLVALRHRARTGEGQFIDVSQCEALLSVLAEPMMDFVLNRRLSPPPGNTRPDMAPYGIFPAAGDDRWLSIAVGSDDEWQALIAVMGKPAWAAAADLATAAGRVRQRERIESALRDWSATFDRDRLVAMLRAAGVAASPVLSATEQRAHPYFRARRIWQRVEHPLSGPEDLYRAPWHLAASRPRITQSAPLLGQHNAEVMSGLLGMDENEIAALTEAGVIA